jgi:hypothetical protein
MGNELMRIIALYNCIIYILRKLEQLAFTTKELHNNCNQKPSSFFASAISWSPLSLHHVHVQQIKVYTTIAGRLTISPCDMKDRARGSLRPLGDSGRESRLGSPKLASPDCGLRSREQRQPAQGPCGCCGKPDEGGGYPAHFTLFLGVT